MTPLRQRMIEDMQLRGLSEKTQAAYVLAVRQLAEHYSKSPSQISEEELRQYFLYLRNIKHVSASTFTVALCGLILSVRETGFVPDVPFEPPELPKGPAGVPDDEAFSGPSLKDESDDEPHAASHAATPRQGMRSLRIVDL